MNKKIKTFGALTTLGLVIIFSFVFCSQAFAGSLEAKKDDVKIYSTAAKTGDVIVSLKKGAALEGKERKGMYWEVTYQGKSGFVSIMDVTAKTEGSANLASALRSAVKESRDDDEIKNARSRSAVMGVRGLAADDENKNAGNVKPNLRMVYAMEDFAVSPQKINELKQKVDQEIEFRMKKQGQ